MISNLPNNNLMAETTKTEDLVDQLNIGVCIIDLSGRIIESNSYFQNMLETSASQLKSKTIRDIFHGDDVELFYKERLHIDATNLTNHENPLIFKVNEKNNQYFKLITSTKFNDKQIILTFQNISQVKSFEQKYEATVKELEYIKSALDKTSTMSIADINGTIIYVNDLFCSESLYTREELIGKNYRILSFSTNADGQYKEMLNDVTQGHIWRGELQNKKKDGSLWWVEATMIPIVDDQNKPYQFIAIRNNISERKMMEEKIERMAYYDFLTNLPNSSYFYKQLNEQLTEYTHKKEPFSLILLEVTNLKFVYDTLGKMISDALLAEVARRLNTFLANQQNSILFKLDGFEFSFIFPNTEVRKASTLAREILHLFDEPIYVNNFELYIYANIGINVYPDTGVSAYDLIKNANSALFHAKKAGNNTFKPFSQNMDIGSLKLFTLKNDFKKALKNDEFIVTYQPKVNPKNYKILGAEALVRWEHPKWGIVKPDEFIPIALEDGYIHELWEIVLQKVCQQNKEWQTSGLMPIRITVNLSFQQLLQADFLKTVEDALKTSELEPEWLKIEITNIEFLEDEKLVLSKIEKLKEMGIKIALDGFRNGYSSLNYLKKVNTDTLIMDPAFVKDLGVNSMSYEIISSIVQVAKKLKIKTVAVGVETEEQLRLLHKIDCDEVQGYLFSKPLHTIEFKSLLKKMYCPPNRDGEELEINYENQRHFFRVDLSYPIEANLTIKELGGKKVQVGSTKILIKDIGAGGCKMETNIKLPVRSDLILQISTVLFGESIDVYGSIIWHRELNAKYGSYGIQFMADDQFTAHLTSLLNMLQVKLRQNSIIPECNFITVSREEFYSQ